MSLKVSIIILSCRSEEIYKYRIKNKNIRRQSDRVSLFRNIAQEANGQKYVVDFHLPSDDDTRICIAGYAYPAIWAWQCARRLTTMIIRHNGPLIDSQASQKGLAGFLKKACESKRSIVRSSPRNRKLQYWFLLTYCRGREIYFLLHGNLFRCFQN